MGQRENRQEIIVQCEVLWVGGARILQGDRRGIKAALGGQERLCKKEASAPNFQKEERSWVSVSLGMSFFPVGKG